MNRKARRIAAKRDLARRSAPSDTIGVPRTVVDLMDKARQSYRQGHGAQAESLCRQVLALMPAHVDSLNLLGIIAQSSGRHKLSVKMLSRAIASDPINAACHYNLGSSYQAVNQHENAATHFKKAIALGLSGNNTEEFITRNPTIATYLDRLEKEQLLLHQTDFFDASGLESIANDLFLRCAMECVVLRGRALEMLLTRLRFAFLRFATANAAAPRPVSDDLVSCLSALALQCFLNEYLYFQTPDETQHSIRLRNLLLEQLNSGCESEPITLAAVAAYFPLYQLPGADKILK